MKKTKAIIQFCENELKVGTVFIAEGFQREHKNVLRLVKKHIKRFENLGVVTERKFKSTGGRPIIEYWLNEQQAAFLGTLFGNQNDIVLDFKLELVKEFYRMKNTLARLKNQRHDPEHIEARESGKVITKLRADLLNDLVPYAIAQAAEAGKVCGYAEKPENCYVNYCSMVNSKVFIIIKGLKRPREYMTTEQLGIVSGAEAIIIKTIRELMPENVEYHDIYKETKRKIMAYADLVGKTDVPIFQIEHNQTRQLELF